MRLTSLPSVAGRGAIKPRSADHLLVERPLSPVGYFRLGSVTAGWQYETSHPLQSIGFSWLYAGLRDFEVLVAAVPAVVGANSLVSSNY